MTDQEHPRYLWLDGELVLWNVMPPRIKAVPNYWNGRVAGNESRRNGYDRAMLLNEWRKVAEGPGASA